MATRSSIKRRQKSKLGAAISMAAGGVALSADAGSSGALDFSGNAAIEAAFRLLEEGQLQALSADSDDADLQRTKMNVSPAGMAGSDTIQDTTAQLPATQGGDAMTADVMALGNGAMGDVLLAQADTAAAASAGGEAGAAAASSASSAGAASAAGAGAAATGVGTLAPLAAIGPLGAAIGLGAVAVAAVADTNSGSAGSDLNDDDNDLPSIQSSISFSGSTTDTGSTGSTNVAAIGSADTNDDSFGSFFA